MQVFKGYQKIVLRNIGLLIMYMCITIGIVVIIQKNQPAAGQEGGFAQAKQKVALIDREGGLLADTLRRYLAREQILTELKDDPAAIQNELFYRNVTYVLVVPENAQAAFEAGERAAQSIQVPGSQAGYYLDAKITSFLNQIRIYRAGGFSMEEACERALALLDTKADVTLLDLNGNGGERAGYNYFFRYLPYGVLAGMIMCLSTVVMEFKKEEIKRRISCSPVKLRVQNLAVIACFLTVSLALWCVCIAVQALLYGGGIFTSPNAPLYLANSFIFMIVAMSLAYLAGMAAKHPAALNALSNIITLGLCFLGGILVPIEMLGGAAKTAAQFLPTYWYSKINGILGDFRTVGGEALPAVFKGFLLQLLFAAACFCLTTAISRARQRES